MTIATATTKTAPVITRNIDPDSAQDLLERVPRACIAFAGQDGPQAQPVAVVWHGQRYFVGIPATGTGPPSSGQEVVLLVDEGVYFFDLRAVYIRGQVQPAAPPPGAAAGHVWFELVAVKIVAWDYGTMHEVNDARG